MVLITVELSCQYMRQHCTARQRTSSACVCKDILYYVTLHVKTKFLTEILTCIDKMSS